MDSYEGRRTLGDVRTTGTQNGLVRSEFKWLLRPASPVEMMDDALALYRENFSLMARVSLLLYLFPIILALLILVPMAYLEATKPATEVVAPALIMECCSWVLLIPYFLAATPLHAVIVSLIGYHRLQGQAITLAQVWAQVKPRLGHLVANQFLAYVVLGIAYTVLYIAFVVIFVGGGVALAAASGGNLSAAVFAALWMLGISIVFLLIAGAVSVWFILLPQVIIFEPETNALSAFSRAFGLVQRNFRHAFLSCLYFWALQTVVAFAVYMLLLILVGLAIWLISIYVGDPFEIYSQWANTIGKLTNVFSYLGFMLVMPAMYLTSFFLYFDLRYRQEGLDIQQILAQGAVPAS